MELLRGQVIPTERKGKKVSQEDKVAWALETFGEVTGDEFTLTCESKDMVLVYSHLEMKDGLLRHLDRKIQNIRSGHIS